MEIKNKIIRIIWILKWIIKILKNFKKKIDLNRIEEESIQEEEKESEFDNIKQKKKEKNDTFKKSMFCWSNCGR